MGKRAIEKPLLVAIIGALAVIIAAIIGYISVRDNTLLIIHATQTAEASCPYHGFDDNQTITNLIQAEADGVNDSSMAIMQTIFYAGATFSDYRTNPPQQWIGPVNRYQNDLFLHSSSAGVEHFDIFPAKDGGINGDMATYTSGSAGKYMVKPAGPWLSYQNGATQQYDSTDYGSIPSTPYGSDHWTLQKDSQGCWMITEFDFDAGNIKFP